jgi:hypothetical protein
MCYIQVGLYVLYIQVGLYVLYIQVGLYVLYTGGPLCAMIFVMAL